jgi:DNA ligase (NAD+)
MDHILQQTNDLIKQSAETYTQRGYDILVDTINHHTDLYHLQQAPIISDYEYDQLFALCKTIESEHPDRLRLDSPTHRVGSDIQDGFEQAPHITPLLSLENSYNAEDLKDRDESVAKLLKKIWVEHYSYLMEPKFDGISMELVYTDGVLVQAITRWDGTVWDDVTNNVRTIRDVPLRLSQPISIRIRWEVIMPKSQFERINAERAATGEALFANPRNAAW